MKNPIAAAFKRHPLVLVAVAVSALILGLLYRYVVTGGMTARQNR
jgi:hypothetical protein